jgi:hypothetical protein
MPRGGLPAVDAARRVMRRGLAGDLDQATGADGIAKGVQRARFGLGENFDHDSV